MSERDPSAPDVKIYEVGPRDGLQNEAEFVPTDSKLELIALLAASGLRRIEVASFVSPSWIPQLADGNELVAAAECDDRGHGSRGRCQRGVLQ